MTPTRKVSQRCSIEGALAVLEYLTAWPLMVVDDAAIRATVRLADPGEGALKSGLDAPLRTMTAGRVLVISPLGDGRKSTRLRLTNEAVPGPSA